MKKLLFVIFVFICCIFTGCGEMKISHNGNYNKYQREVYWVEKSSEDVFRMNVIGLSSEYMIYEEELDVKKIDDEYIKPVRYYKYDLSKQETVYLGEYNSNIYKTAFYEDGHYIICSRDGDLYLYNKLNQLEKNIFLWDLLNIEEHTSLFLEAMWTENDVLFLIYRDDNLLQRVAAIDFNNEEFLGETDTYEELLPYLNEQGENKVLIKDDYSFLKYNKATKCFEKSGTVSKKLAVAVGNNTIVGDGNADIYFYNEASENAEYNENLLELNGEKIHKVFSFEQMGIEKRFLSPDHIYSDQQGGFWIALLMADANRIKVFHLQPSEEVHDYTKDKMVVTIGGMNIPFVLQDMVTAFNASSDEYTIQLIDYWEEGEDYQDAITRFNLDIIKGDVLDGYSLDGLSVDNLYEKGALQDWNGYFSWSEQVDLDDVSEAFRNMTSREDGRIIYLMPCYQICTYMYSENISFDDLSPYENSVYSNHVFFADDVNYTLCDLLRYSGDRYIDVQNEKSHLKEQAFQSLLSLLKKQKEIMLYDYEPRLQYCRGQASVLRTNITYPTWFFYYEKLMVGEKKGTMPVGEGYFVSPSTCQIGISSSTDKTEAFYRFADFILSDDIYMRNLYYEGIPILEKHWDLWKEELLASESKIDQYSRVVGTRDYVLGYDVAKVVIERGSITEEDFAAMRNACESAQYCSPLPDKYIEVIFQESQPYFEGTATLDEVIEIMDRKVNLMLSE